MTHEEVINAFRRDFGEEQQEVVTNDMLIEWIKAFYNDLTKFVPNLQVIEFDYVEGGTKIPSSIHTILTIKDYTQLDIYRDFDEWLNNDYVWYIDGDRVLHIKPDQNTTLTMVVEKAIDTSDVTLESDLKIPDTWAELIETYLKMKLCLRYDDLEKVSAYAQLVRSLLNQYREWINRNYEVQLEWRK